ncbi:hypothetical protein RvY_11186 [Ramazzottius varieornatus]|uniref:Uncharacterized protein n=1 Tax=Ramazzottius varieornatus TaxID=947166 RepID=A0A1D1VP63_RAMVA|nr:hypothetical protein RvY_11186 [Ramazzottius varieornatus]
MDHSDMTSKARLMAVSTKTSGTWLHALLASLLGNLLDDNTLRISVGLRLRSRLCQLHMCRCGKVVDEYGLRGLSCLKSAGRHSRHASLSESVRRALVSAQVSAVLEPLGLSRDHGLRPDGKTMIPWKNGKELVWDVTLVDTLAKFYVGKTSEKVGAAAKDAEERKIQKYQGIASQYFFVSWGFETFGSYGPAATELINAIGEKLVEFPFETRSLHTRKDLPSIPRVRSMGCRSRATVDYRELTSLDCQYLGRQLLFLKDLGALPWLEDPPYPMSYRVVTLGYQVRM